MPAAAADTPAATSLTRVYETFSQPVVAAFCAGGVAGAVSRTVVSPLERLKILFQVQSVGREAYKLSVGQGLAKMWREEGWRGFMRGNGTNCVRIVPYSAVQFGSYNFYKRVSTHSSLLCLVLAMKALPAFLEEPICMKPELIALRTSLRSIQVRTCHQLPA